MRGEPRKGQTVGWTPRSRSQVGGEDRNDWKTPRTEVRVMGKGCGGHSSHTDGILAPDTCHSGKSAMHALAVALFCGALRSCVLRHTGFLGSEDTILARQAPGVR